MPDLRKLKTDAVAERDGVWVDCLIEGWEPDPPVNGGEPRVARFKIARWENERFAARRLELWQENQLFIRAGGKYAEDAAIAMQQRLIGETIIVGWENVSDGGVEVPYSPEAATQAMKDYPDLLRWIKERAQERAPYRLKDDETARKNS